MVREATAAGGRDEAWFRELFLATAARVESYVQRRWPGDTDDLVAEVYTAAWARRELIPEGGELPWLYAAAAREILHAQRGFARADAAYKRVAQAPAAPADDAFDRLVAGLDAAVPVRAAMAALSAADAEILRLWAWERLEPAEIAQVLQIRPTATRVRLHRARARLAAGLAPVGEEDADSRRAGHRPIDPTALLAPAAQEGENRCGTYSRTWTATTCVSGY